MDITYSIGKFTTIINKTKVILELDSDTEVHIVATIDAFIIKAAKLKNITAL